MQPGRTTNTGGGTMEVKAAAPRCQLLLILLMSAVMLLPGTNGSLLLIQRTVTRTIVLQETIGKEEWIRKMWYIYTMEYYAAEKNNDIVKFAGKWMELENVILSKLSHPYELSSLVFMFFTAIGSNGNDRCNDLTAVTMLICNRRQFVNFSSVYAKGLKTLAE
ncbi:hypothetical protein STEG23_024982 [Scotinomys teguina]